MKKLPIRSAILPIISSLGVLFSIVLTHQYYEIRSGAGGFKSICNISEKLNCDAVTASPFAELIGGLPVSSFALGWFVATLILGLMALNSDWKKQASRGLLALFGIGSGISLVYLVIMASVLKTYCLFCLIIDGLNFSGLAVVLTLMRHPETEKKSSQGTPAPTWKFMAGILATSIFVSLVLSKTMDQIDMDATMRDQIVESVLETSPTAVNTGKEFPSIGPENAPITIVEFSDFQCPYCRIGANIVNTLLNRYPQQVRVVFRNFPLDPSCNPEVKQSMHPFACELARIAICAHRQGKFKEVYENFFENQSKLSNQGPGSPLELAKAAHADTTQLPTCTSGQDIALALTRDIEEAKRLGITSTPTFFINGKKVEGIRPPHVWNKIIDRMIQTSQKSGGSQ